MTAFPAPTNLRAMVEEGIQVSARGRAVLVGASVVVPAACAWAFRHRPQSLEYICQEDGLVENATAILYFLASVAVGKTLLRGGWRSPWLWCYALLFLFVAGEEISWGQRVFGIETPAALARSNVQGELNLHNIEGAHDKVRLFAGLFVLLTCVMSPLLDRLSERGRRLHAAMRVPVVPPEAGVAAVAGMLTMVGARLAEAPVYLIDEAGELLVGIGFYGFARALRRLDVTSRPPGERSRAR